MKHTLPLLSVGVILFAGCSRPSQNHQKAAQALVNSITGNAKSSRDQARTLRADSDTLLAAKNYNGAMDKRLQILAPRSKRTTLLSTLSSFSTQSLVTTDLSKIASHLDAPSCRKYAKQLQAIDAQTPTFGAVLQGEQADQLKMFARATRTPQEWQRLITGLGFTATQQATLQKTSPIQVQTNIKNAYAILGKWSQQTYSPKMPPLSGDPYTLMFGVSAILNTSRFFWTKAKTERLFAIAALQQRADRLENRKRVGPLPTDPFGTGPLKEKGAAIYSVGPDTKDDGAKPVPSPMRLRITDTGDMLAPTF